MSLMFAGFFCIINKNKTRSKTTKEGRLPMETKYYVVSRIDGDYAWLDCTSAQEEPYFIARALLPMEADEGSRLKFENFQFEMI